MDLRTQRFRSRLAGLLLALGVMAAFLVANLPYPYVERGGHWRGSHSEFADQVLLDTKSLPVMAGWPFRYGIAYDVERAQGGQGDPILTRQTRRWSFWNLALNACIALAAAAGAYLFTQWRHHRLIQSRGNPRIQKRLDGLVASAVLLLPLGIWGWAQWEASRQRVVVQQISRSGCCYLSCWLPEPLATRVPSWLLPSLDRIRLVRLEQPDDRLVRLTSHVPTLVGLRVIGSDCSQESLRPLVSLPHFRGLCLNDQELTEATMQTLSRLRWLSRLSLSRTNLNASHLRQLGGLDQLEVIDLSLTPLRLADLGKPQWSRSMQRMSLPRPTMTQGDQLVLDGWPQLEYLAITHPSLQLNHHPLQVSLADLPRLHRLSIDRVQKHALSLEDLPRLSRIDEEHNGRLQSLYRDRQIPGQTWASRVRLENLPSLHAAGFSVADLTELVVRQVPNLRNLQLGAYTIDRGEFVDLGAVDPQRCQAWINELGEGDGASTVDLTGLPLKGVDLSPLVRNQRIRILKIPATGATVGQVKQLAGMSQLRELNLGEIEIRTEDLHWLTDNLPNLRRLRASCSHVLNLELNSSTRLTEFWGTPFHDLTSLRLIDVPQLSGTLRLLNSPEKLEIRGAQSLMGLAVGGTWPENSVIEGVRQLRWFAAAGSEVDDQVVDAILDCADLHELTLAHTSVSRDKWSEIGSLQALTRLWIPGADIDDDVTDHWRDLRRLQHVSFAETSVGIRTLAWLSRLESLRSLSLDRVQLDESACEMLTRLTRLSELSLAGTPLAESSLITMLGSAHLEELDLSGTSLSPALVAAIGSAPALRRLTLNNTPLERGQVESLLHANARLWIASNSLDRLSAPLLARNDARRPRSSRQEPAVPPVFSPLALHGYKWRLSEVGGPSTAGASVPGNVVPGRVDALRVRETLTRYDSFSHR